MGDLHLPDKNHLIDILKKEGLTVEMLSREFGWSLLQARIILFIFSPIFFVLAIAGYIFGYIQGIKHILKNGGRSKNAVHN